MHFNVPYLKTNDNIENNVIFKCGGNQRIKSIENSEAESRIETKRRIVQILVFIQKKKLGLHCIEGFFVLLHSMWLVVVVSIIHFFVHFLFDGCCHF